MIYQQVGILFFTPIVVSFIHGAVALKAMYAVLDQPMQLAGWEVFRRFLIDSGRLLFNCQNVLLQKSLSLSERLIIKKSLSMHA